jgi:hypothetical protein
MECTFYHGLSDLNLLLAVIAGLVGLVRYRLVAPSLRLVALLAIFDALAELTFFLIGTLLHTPNLFMAPLIIVGEVLLAALAYGRALQSAAFNKALPWLLGLFGTYALVESLLRLSATRHLVSLEIISNLLQLGLAGLYFQKLLNELRVKRLWADPFFWLSAALAVYGLGNLLISLSSNYVLTHCSLQLQRIILLGVRNTFNIQLYLAYCLALCLRPLRAKSLSV